MSYDTTCVIILQWYHEILRRDETETQKSKFFELLNNIHCNVEKNYVLFSTFCTCKYSKFSLIIVTVTGENVGRDSSVGIATRYGLDGPGIESRWW
jgi:hypothetical protein